MIGLRFNMLVVLRETRKPGVRGRFYVCRCDCGAEAVAYGGHLRAGGRKSCGCALAASKRTHGMSRTPEYKAWDGARARCNNPANRKYPLYGGRGIRMADEWLHSFSAFIAEVGPRPSLKHSLDRKDNDRGYEPGNVRWATTREQNINRRPQRPKKMGVQRATSG